ncbi:hypothetical protein COX85_00340 [Candidatus Micrarchaeota archaeon CG_4_10_14_0_2_um_filter_55_9]|nr:MAG: hypothetical protein COX85_00340 [Candidatus Micrarchaeota archaeon CG_4_10_14_0_2_um_filter_55_9]
MAFDEKVSKKISRETISIKEKIKEANSLIAGFAAAYPILLLGDQENYGSLKEAKQKLGSQGLSALMLEEVASTCLSDATKMDCINGFEGTILMVAGKNPGTATETTIIRKNKALRHKTHLFFEGGIPDYAKNVKDYPMYFPRKTGFKNEKEFVETICWVARQDAFVHANDKAMEKLGDKHLNGENQVVTGEAK